MQVCILLGKYMSVWYFSGDSNRLTFCVCVYSLFFFVNLELWTHFRGLMLAKLYILYYVHCWGVRAH